MRLLYVIDSLAPGGAETSLVEMAPGLISRGIELHVLPLGERLDLAPALEAAGATVHRRIRHTRRAGNVREVLRVARATRPDLIHTTLYEADVAGRIAARLAHLPVSTSVVGDTYGSARTERLNKIALQLAKVLDRLTARLAVRFHSVSDSLAIACTQHLGVPMTRIEVIPRGRSANRYAYRPTGVRAATRQALGLADSDFVILTVGRLEPIKGLETLISALPAVVAEISGVVVLMAGKEGRSSAALRSAAQGLQLDIRFLGHRTDVADLMAAADVLCFPSLSEGSPGTLIEAMATGCTIVASDIPANLEVLGTRSEPAPTARLFRAGNSMELAVALTSALLGTDENQAMIETARHRFENEYQLEAISARMKTFFEHAAAEPVARVTLRPGRGLDGGTL